MDKPKVYVETSFVSVLTARPSRDVLAAANQTLSFEWWEIRRAYFDLLISPAVRAEAQRGNPEAARRRLELIADLPMLEVDENALDLQKALIARGALPTNPEIDAFHVAIAAVNGIDYLLTWNCAHIANAAMRPLIEAVCRENGYQPPIICTPSELMGDSDT